MTELDELFAEVAVHIKLELKLCSRCNFALGGFRDDPDLLQKAAAYLIRYKGVK